MTGIGNALCSRGVQLACGLAVPLVAAVLFDIQLIRSAEVRSFAVAFAVAAVAGIVVTPIVLFRALPVAQPDTDGSYVVRVLLTLVGSALWYFIGFTIFVNVHLAFGGAI